jgi:tetratricopeptide (TPR) repeat protein
MAFFDTLWDFDDPSGTENRFREVLESKGSLLTPGERAELLSQIARTLGLQRRFAEAYAVLDEADALRSGDPIANSRCELERGRALNSEGRRAEAVPHFEQALAAVAEVPDGLGEDRQPSFYAVDALHMLAIASLPDEQMRHHLEAIARAEASSSPATRGWLGSLLNNLGWTLHDTGEFERALDSFERALAFRREQGKEEPIRIARWAVARCLRSLGRHAEALRAQEELSRDCREAGAPDGFVEEEIAECLLALGRAEDGRRHFAEAHRLLAQMDWLRQDEPERLARLEKLARS